MKSPISYPPTRRELLLGAAVLAGAGATTLVALPILNTSGTEKRYLRRVLAAYLPGVSYSDQSLDGLRDDLLRETFDSLNRERKFLLLSTAGSVLPMGLSGPGKRIAAEVDDAERAIVSTFILGSDFLDFDDPKDRTVTYNGLPSACGNPFARFEI